MPLAQALEANENLVQHDFFSHVTTLVLVLVSYDANGIIKSMYYCMSH